MAFLIYALNRGKCRCVCLSITQKTSKHSGFKSSVSINTRQSQRLQISTMSDLEKVVVSLVASNEQGKDVLCIKCFTQQQVVTLVPLTVGVTQNSQPNRNMLVFGQPWPLDLFRGLVCCPAYRTYINTKGACSKVT